MTFSAKAIIRALVAPDHGLRCSASLWRSVMTELDRRGARRHEAGVFLLGTTVDDRRVAQDVVFYDDLDANAYSTGVCVLHAPAFAKLWAICRERGLSVVADVHTHGGRAIQSEADRTNPMVARAGHIAIIVPDFARPSTRMRDVGIYEYRGNHMWAERSPRRMSGFFYVGMWS